jgi:hypothetical protein
MRTFVAARPVKGITVLITSLFSVCAGGSLGPEAPAHAVSFSSHLLQGSPASACCATALSSACLLVSRRLSVSMGGRSAQCIYRFGHGLLLGRVISCTCAGHRCQSVDCVTRFAVAITLLLFREMSPWGDGRQAVIWTANRVPLQTMEL